jgi:predicted ferric reductase
MAALYLHVPSKELTEPPTVYLLVAICLQGLIGLLRFVSILYRNVQYKKPLNRALIKPISYKRPNASDIPVSDAVHMHVKLSRSCKPRAGQWFYVCIPGLSYTAFIQSHPLYVSWCYRDDDGNDYAVFIIQKQRGFTRNLFLYTSDYFDDTSTMRAIMEGPYGKEMRLDLYGTVLLFATGIGIASQLPYVAQLLEGYRECKVKTRKIELFWEVESECKCSCQRLNERTNELDRSYCMGR